MKAFYLSERITPWCTVAALLTLSACSMVPSDPSFDSLSGSIVQGDHSPLAPGSVVIVRLEDRSARDGFVNVVAEQRIERPSGLPISFRLKYDSATIAPGHRYVLTASMYAGNERIYATDVPPTVITSGQPGRVQLVLERTDAAHRPD